MTKEIELTEVRQCCQEAKGDLVMITYFQCIHCGDEWRHDQKMDAAGDLDTELVRRNKL